MIEEGNDINEEVMHLVINNVGRIDAQKQYTIVAKGKQKVMQTRVAKRKTTKAIKSQEGPSRRRRNKTTVEKESDDDSSDQESDEGEETDSDDSSESGREGDKYVFFMSKDNKSIKKSIIKHAKETARLVAETKNMKKTQKKQEDLLKDVILMLNKMSHGIEKSEPTKATAEGDTDEEESGEEKEENEKEKEDDVIAMTGPDSENDVADMDVEEDTRLMNAEAEDGVVHNDDVVENEHDGKEKEAANVEGDHSCVNKDADAEAEDDKEDIEDAERNENEMQEKNTEEIEKNTEEAVCDVPTFKILTQSQGSQKKIEDNVQMQEEGLLAQEDKKDTGESGWGMGSQKNSQFVQEMCKSADEVAKKAFESYSSNPRRSLIITNQVTSEVHGN
ncbi:unnamed protein product [Cuscuta europaea]|uniref:Uncharacterized protein n=1 Tax=Cuscuta europaea TaxID=41803 RepID=A0A9P1E560_CUSEU|nr:unnamed protein product [Cuscuta europaea]